MMSYYLRLAAISLKQTPIITSLIIGAIALGIGVFMTIYSAYYLLSGNPIPAKSDRLFAVQIDSWDPESPYDDEIPDAPPTRLTYKDSVAILGSGIPMREAAMYKTQFVVDPVDEGIEPFSVIGRLTGGDFFEMFNVPFIYGGVWDQNAYDNAERVVVIDKETNDKLFAGENSVGRNIELRGLQYTIVGVRDTWSPSIKFYDAEHEPFDTSENIYAPFTLFEAYQLPRYGSTNCWKDELLETYSDLLGSECVWPTVWVELIDEQQINAYLEWLDAYVLEQQKLGRLERPLNNRLSDVMSWLAIHEVADDDAGMMVVIAFLFLAVCMVNMIGLLLARFVGKAGVIGVRRALGASKYHIFIQHLVEVALVGVVGGVLGIVLAMFGFEGIQYLWPEWKVFDGLNLALVSIGLLIGLASSLLAGVYPTWRICQLPPAQYLKTQ